MIAVARFLMQEIGYDPSLSHPDAMLMKLQSRTLKNRGNADGPAGKKHENAVQSMNKLGHV